MAMLIVLLPVLLLVSPAVYADSSDGRCPCPKGQCCSNAGYCGTSNDYCGKGHCGSQCPGGCFPGDAVVQLSNGESRFMTELSIGDKVRTYNGGKFIMEEIYAFGHNDFNSTSEFVKLVAIDESGQVANLEITKLHFIPVLSKSSIYKTKRAQDVELGDVILASNSSDQAFPYVVKDISEVTKNGMYNPYTLSGSIIVNNVLVSTHSEWFLDGFFEALRVTHMLPAVYQAVLAPARGLFYILGKENYVALYNFIDAWVNIPEFGTKYGGGIAISAVVAGAGAGIANKMRHK